MGLLPGRMGYAGCLPTPVLISPHLALASPSRAPSAPRTRPEGQWSVTTEVCQTRSSWCMRCDGRRCLPRVPHSKGSASRARADH
jgi:hypothetical protein